MGLKNLKSNLDIHGGNQAISQGGNPGGMLRNPNPPYDGGAFAATGPNVGELDNDYDNYRDSGNSDSPFDRRRIRSLSSCVVVVAWADPRT